MTSTENLIHDLLRQTEPTARGKWQSVKQRLGWVCHKSAVQECLQALERRKQYFTMVLSSNNSKYVEEIYSEVMWLGQRSNFERQKLLATWLGVADYHSQHAIYLTIRQPGTGSWFIHGPLESWFSRLASSTRVLWLQGKSGCGKSIIASYAIERTTVRINKRRQNSSAVLYFHCNFNDTSTHSANAVIASLVHQMCEKQPNLWNQVHRVEQKPVSGTQGPDQQASLDQLKQLYMDVSIQFSKLYVFLDAPNESPDCAAILSTLGKAIQSHPFMQLCMFSPSDLSMQPIESLKVLYTCVKMDEEQQRQEQNKDFRTCIENVLHKHSSLSTLPKDLKSYITQGLSAKADGSFRWVFCQLESLADQDTIADVRRALQSLPPSLHTHYRDTLVKVSFKERVRVKRLLRWLSLQIRPMRITELSEAVVIAANPNKAVLTEEERLVDKNRKMESYLKSVSSLVSYDSKTQIVTLAHSSVKEFLLSPSWQGDEDLKDLAIGNYGSALGKVLDVCLWYILQEPFCRNFSGSVSPLERSWPFYDYCAQAWPHYVEKLSAAGYNLNAIERSYIRRLFKSAENQEGGSYRFWLQEYAANYVPKQGQAWTMLRPLHLAAGHGWLSLVQLILATDKRDIDTTSGETLLTPVLRASVYRHVDTVRCLINAGANPALETDKPNVKYLSQYFSPEVSKLINITS